MSENLAHPRHTPSPAGSGWPVHGTHAPGSAGPGSPLPGLSGLDPPGWGPIHLAGAETAVLAAPHAADRHSLTAPRWATPRSAAMRLLAEEHIAAHGGALRSLASPPHALLVRTARDHAETLDARLRLLLGENAVASFDLPEQAEALSA